MSKDAILNKVCTVQKVENPEWPEAEVWVRKLNGRQVERALSLIEGRAQASNSTQGKAESNGKVSDARLTAELFILLTCDVTGTPLFGADDVDVVLDQCEFAPVQRCVEAGLEFNYMTEESYRKLRGNSKRAPRAARG
ncbi:MAG: hypothetical protein GTO41_28710 [Burkholderiales bacterium]|nr:hypothetical protein [Burkholderiales bacterium]